MVHWDKTSHAASNGISISSAVFAWLENVTKRHNRHRHTDRPCYSVYSKSTRCDLKTKMTLRNVRMPLQHKINGLHTTTLGVETEVTRATIRCQISRNRREQPNHYSIRPCPQQQRHFYPRGASYARVLAVVVRLCVCHTPVLYQNG